MSPQTKVHSPRTIFGIREEHIVAALMIPLLFGCLFTEPFIVEVKNFNSGTPSEILSYGPGGGNDTVSFNITKYVALGNWTTNGVFRNFTVRLCPTSGTPSNIRIYWPYTNNSYLMWPGNLVGCQDVDVDASGFDSYFETDMMPIIDFIDLFVGGTPEITFFNTVMLRDPRMYHVSEDVWYTLATPEDFPSGLIENITGQSVNITSVYGIAYTCYEGDSLRYVYDPAVRINVSLVSSNLTLPIIGPIPFSGIVNATARIYDMYCPPYLAEGKYRMKVKMVNITVENASINYTETMFSDDFAGSSIGNEWLVFSQQGPEIAYYEDNWATGTYDMFSLNQTSGILTYYNRSLLVDENNYVWVEFNISTTELGTAMTSSAGAVLFTNETHPPDLNTAIGPHGRGGMIFGDNTWAAFCPNMVTVINISLMAPGWHTFGINLTNDSMTYYFDGAYSGFCPNATNETVYIGMAADPLIDQFWGNVSVDWANVTTFTGGAVSSTMFDDFNAPLDTSRWLPIPVNGTYAYYETGNSLWMYSFSPSNASGIIAYLINPPILNPNELAANLSSMNLSNYTNFTGFKINEVGWNISVTMNTSNANASDFSISMLQMNFTWPPFANYTDLNDSFRGGLAFNGTDGVAICPDGTYLGGGAIPPGVYTFSFLSTNLSFDMFVNGMPVGSCPPVNETLFLALSTDPTVDLYQGGKASFEEVSISAFAEINGSGSLWLEVPDGLVQADVIVCNCPHAWNRPFDFAISSDTQGDVNITILNITYESLIDYSNEQPTVTLTNTDLFSWMAYNSTISNSEVRFQSGIGNSNIENSNIIMADIDCANVSDSNLTIFVYTTKNLTKYFIEAGLGDPGLPWGDLPCGRIENTIALGGVFIGGDMVNSELYGVPVMGFADFENARIQNMYLSRGNMSLNFTKWVPNITSLAIPVIDLDFGILPLGCAEEAMVRIDGAPYFVLKQANTTSLDCWLYFANSHNITLDEVIFNNALGGPTISLRNSTVRLTNINYDFNVKLKQPEAYAVLWGLNNGVMGDIYLSSNYIHTENSMFAMDSNYYGFLNGTNVTVVFENIYTYDGIYYYPNFTRNISLVINNGTLCGDTQCRNLTYNATSRELSFNTNNFSSYAIVRFDQPSTPPGGPSGGDEIMITARELVCPDNLLRITVTGRTGSAVQDVRLALQYDYGTHYGSEGIDYTDSGGIGEFTLSKEGDYRLSGSKNGYVNTENLFSIELCSEEPPPEEPEEETELAEEPEEEPEAEEIAEEEPEEEILEEINEEPEEIIIPPEEPEAEIPEECCLLGICGALIGICWYWWLLLIILIIVGLILSGAIFAIGKSGGSKSRKR